MRRFLAASALTFFLAIGPAHPAPGRGKRTSGHRKGATGHALNSTVGPYRSPACSGAGSGGSERPPATCCRLEKLCSNTK